MEKRKELSRMLKTWLRQNRHGKLTSDQWLNLVTQPIATLLIFLVPITFIVMFSPARAFLRYARYGRYVIPVFIVAAVVMLLLRARYFATRPLHYEVLYGNDHQSLGRWFSRLQPRLTVYSEGGRPVVFQNFVSSPPYLEPDMPYMVYFLESADQQRTLLSFAPLEHPDAQMWQPSDKFYSRQQKRQRI